jgi:hypothetical protein
MNAPAWLPVILAAVMLVIAACSLWRIVMARILGTPSGPVHDLAFLLLAFAAAGMLVRWMHVLRPGIWALILAAAALGIALAVVLLGYAVAALDRLPRSPHSDSVEAAAGGASVVRAFAPRTLALCEVAIEVTMADPILAKLV